MDRNEHIKMARQQGLASQHGQLDCRYGMSDAMSDSSRPKWHSLRLSPFALFFPLLFAHSPPLMPSLSLAFMIESSSSIGREERHAVVVAVVRICHTISLLAAWGSLEGFALPRDKRVEVKGC